MATARTWRLISIILAAVTVLILGISRAVPATRAQPFDQGILDVDLHLNDEHVTVNTQTGEVSVTGTVSCSQPAGMAGQLFLSVDVTQPVGQIGAVHGSRGASGACLGFGDLPFVLTVTGFDGRFVTGLAYLHAFVSNCLSSPPPPEPTFPPPEPTFPPPEPTTTPGPTTTPMPALEQQQIFGCDTDEAFETVSLLPSLTTPPEQSLQTQRKEP
jgi:hypothetical protein